MTTHDMQQHMWQAHKDYAFTASELALLAFLTQEFAKHTAKTTLLWITDEQLCKELDVTRHKLRAARRQLVRCRLLQVCKERGNRGGASYGLLIADRTNTLETRRPMTKQSSPSFSLYYLEETLCKKKEERSSYSTDNRKYQGEVDRHLPIMSENVEPTSLREVITYFIDQGYLNPVWEAQKFWKMLYWKRRPELHWHNSAALWNYRSIEYLEKQSQRPH